MGPHQGMIARPSFFNPLLMLIPQNAYSTELDMDPSPLMVVDVMHDVELGFGRGIITHILRLFLAEGGGVTEEFDARLVPPKW